jgi:hypothetical protein
MKLQFALVATLLALGSASPKPTADDDPIGFTQVSAEDVDKYWTEERMANAKPAMDNYPDISSHTFTMDKNDEGGQLVEVPPVLNHASKRTPFPGIVKTAGKVFFSTSQGNFVCSGSLVNSRTMSLVVTAGHCVYDTTTKAAVRNFIFIPSYRNGAGLGRFTARVLATLSGWVNNRNFNYDIGMVLVNRLNGLSLQNIVGQANGIRFNPPRKVLTYSFGYPVAMSGGQILQFCRGVTQASLFPGHTGEALACDMTGGCSGGPWLQDFNTATTLGYVSSVNSFLLRNRPGFLMGPYFGIAARNLYNFIIAK